MSAKFISTPAKLWDSVSRNYEEHSYQREGGAYPANSFRSEILLDFFRDKPKGKVLDAGCGPGEMTRSLLALGWDVTSVDYSEGMLETAKQKTKEANLVGNFHHCSLFELEKLNEKFDYVMLNGVLPYIAVEEEPKVFEQLKKVMNPSAYLLSSHYNYYFDIFAFDQWTVEALVTGTLESAGVPEKELEKAKQKISSLLNNSEIVLDKERTMRNENPLMYKQKLRSFGFDEFDQAYYNFFYLPAKFEAEQDQGVREKLERSLRRDHHGLLLGRTFVSLAKRRR